MLSSCVRAIQTGFLVFEEGNGAEAQKVVTLVKKLHFAYKTRVKTFHAFSMLSLELQYQALVQYKRDGREISRLL